MTVFAGRAAALVRRRATRRLSVVLLYAGVVTYAVSMTAGHAFGAHPPAHVRLLLIPAMLGALIAAPIGYCGLMIQWGLQRMLNGPDALVDERMMARRHLALAIAFRILGLVAALETLVWSLRPFGMVPASVDLASPFIYGSTVLALTLPLAILAWIEPDAEAGDS